MAQRALFLGGTLENGKVAVQRRRHHGPFVRHLIAMVDFNPDSVVTCYGGFLEAAPRTKGQTNAKTHMRRIPASDFVLNGWAFSETFPSSSCGMQTLGYNVNMCPEHDDPEWVRIIRTTGLGYMANTKTICPMKVGNGTNVTIGEAKLGRVIPGIPYSSIMVLKACAAGIKTGDPIISPYRSYALKDKFWFKCIDRGHYYWSGREHTFPNDE